MINTLRLTHLILFYVVRGFMFRSSLTIIRPICESCFTNAGYILGSHYAYNYAIVYTCYINTLKSGDGIVNGTGIIRGRWVCSWGRRTASLLVFLVFLLTCSLEDYGRSVSSGVIFYVGPVGGLWVCVSYHSYGITSNGPGLYLDNGCEAI